MTQDVRATGAAAPPLPPAGATAPPPVAPGFARQLTRRSHLLGDQAETVQQPRPAEQNTHGQTGPGGGSAGEQKPPPVAVERRAVQRPPKNLDEIDVPTGLIEDIFMRRLLALKQSSTSDMASDLALSLSVVHQIADRLRDKNLLEYLGLDGRDYRFTLTESGHQATNERLKVSMYAGRVPVSLGEYERVIEFQRKRPPLSRESTEGVMRDLIMPRRLIDKLGAAMLNEGAVFIYGPPGTGKTSMAERIGQVSADSVLVPYCIEVDGNVVVVFDPSIHKPVEQPPGLDPRWIACERPFVIVGGELNMGMLELNHDPVTGVYSAPKQLLANNGILVIDDFGRQLVSPDEILNRWIVPLSRSIDFLKMANGTTFTTPFAVKLIVSSNLDPNSLGDEAFLRRLRNKVYVGSCSETEFDEILDMAAESSNVSLTDTSAEVLRKVAYHYVGALRPYIAVDFCDLMSGICEYENRPTVMDEAMIADVAELYFVSPEQDDLGPTRAG